MFAQYNLFLSYSTKRHGYRWFDWSTWRFYYARHVNFDMEYKFWWVTFSFAGSSILDTPQVLSTPNWTVLPHLLLQSDTYHIIVDHIIQVCMSLLQIGHHIFQISHSHILIFIRFQIPINHMFFIFHQIFHTLNPS